MYNLCIFLTTDQKVTGLNPVGVTKKSAVNVRFSFFMNPRPRVSCSEIYFRLMREYTKNRLYDFPTNISTTKKQ